MGEPFIASTGVRLAQAPTQPQPETPPPAQPQPAEPAPELPWGERPTPPTATPATEGSSDDTTTPPSEPVPWSSRPTPSTFVRQPLFPELRIGFTGQYTHVETTSTHTGGGRFGIMWANPSFTVVPTAGDVPIPISFYPRIETTINPEFQSAMAGLSVFLLPPDELSLYVSFMGGMMHTTEPTPAPDNQSYHGAFSTDIGFQFRIPVRSPLFQFFVEYNHSWIEPVITNGASAGLRFQL